LETFTIVTTHANELLETMHDRMPVILAPEDYDRWLQPGDPPVHRSISSERFRLTR
jgi:putative SOS response-associated peptidase YedK